MTSSRESSELRNRTEEILARSRQRLAEGAGPIEQEGLLHELEIHQIELEMQNEELRATQLELQEARDRYFELYELAPVGYLTLDDKGRILQANLTAAALLGRERQHLPGRWLSQVISSDEVDRFHFFWRAIFAEPDETHRLELKVRVSERRRGLLLEAMSVREGDALRCRMAILDVTDRWVVEEELRDREVRLAALLDTVPDGVIAIDAELRIESVNPAAERIFGGTASQIVGRPLALLVPALFEDKILSSMVGRVSECMGRRRDGGAFPLELSLGLLGDGRHRPRAHGQQARYVAVVRDVSARRRQEEELRESLLRFRQMAERIEDVFYIAEAATGRGLYVSPAFETVFGRKWEPDPSGQQTEAWLAWVHPDDRERIRAAWERARQGTSFVEEQRIVRPDGSLRLVRHRCFPMASLGRIIGVLEDVTEERRTEESLRQAQRLEAIGTLASGVAHDFNNLLMGIAGGMALAIKHLPPDHPAYTPLRRVREAIGRGASITRRLLRFSDARAREGGLLELDALVVAATELQRGITGENIRLVIETGVPGVCVRGEEGDIQQVLMNLVSNARDAMPRGGTLTVRTFGESDRAILTVTDTGHGMDAGTRARVFEPFFTTKEVGRGTGLGLSTVFGIVRRLGGQLDLETAPGRGTTVRVSLPTVARDELAAAPAGAFSGGRGTVLVVEDEPLVGATVQSYLESLGHEALLASSPEEALALSEQRCGRIDLLLTDVMMPGKTGPELAREMGRKSPALPVLFMSAHPRDELVRLGRLSPEAHVLSKPFDEASLGAAVAESLAERSLRHPKVDQVDQGIEPARSAVAAGASQGTPTRVLVVDDDPDLADVLRDTITGLGHRVAVARNGQDAIAAARDMHPDVVLCDLNLGEGLSGYDVARALRAQEGLEPIRLVALTGFDGEEYRRRAREAGFDQVASKAGDLDQIQTLVEGPI